MQQKESLHESWLTLVYGPRRRKTRRRRPRDPNPTDPVEWRLVPLPQRASGVDCRPYGHGGFHRNHPPVARGKHAKRHDIPKPRPVSAVLLREAWRQSGALKLAKARATRGI